MDDFYQFKVIIHQYAMLLQNEALPFTSAFNFQMKLLIFKHLKNENANIMWCCDPAIWAVGSVLIIDEAQVHIPFFNWRRGVEPWLESIRIGGWEIFPDNRGLIEVGVWRAFFQKILLSLLQRVYSPIPVIIDVQCKHMWVALQLTLITLKV